MSAVQPLVMKGVNNTSDDIISGNLVATFSRAYEPMPYSEKSNGKPVSVVGAGFSLSWTYKDIVGDVIACNSAHDFLISKGIVPKYAMIWDANPIMKDILKTPHKDVTYLIASRCHPSVFEKLKDFKVLVWHALGSDGIEAHLSRLGKMEPMIAGGSSSVMRAIYVAAALGYTKEMHIFGVCDENDGKNTHVIGSLINQNFMKIRICGRWFNTTSWIAMQAGDAKAIFPILQKIGVKLSVHGRGLLPYCATFMEGVQTPDIHVSLYEKLRRELHALILLYLEFRGTPNYIGGFNAGY